MSLHTKAELVFLRSMMGGDSVEQSKANVARLGLTEISPPTIDLWKNLYIPMLQDNRMYVNSVVTGRMSMIDVISNIHRRMKG